ncbi:hypothetical protein AMS68_007351 [Peltaster fructicola]|uniref:Steroid 5-alpha reductase C-terminal domain-containing protein n=1 Tax=Peltaster fructicola TaxID=286661 RepID=A0A6H0Y496_9PEZI|nr:hypothetical protein AMS68_007351 [Peltaster fructicola]
MPPSNASRGDQPQSSIGFTIFISSRLLSPAIQYAVLANGYGDSLIRAMGGTVLPQYPALINNLSTTRGILLGMSAIAALKHVIHITAIMNGRMEPSFAIEQALYNDVSDTIASLLLICAQTSANPSPFPQASMLVGAAFFAIGIGLELGSEVQRSLWKRDPANKGKVYEHGGFGLSRHINYFGFTLWRTGYAIASGGFVLGAVGAFWASYSFINGSIPRLQQYLEKKVRQIWHG